MIITVYNKRGYPVETLEDVLVPRPTTTNTLYIEYEGMGFKVITKLVREPGKGETEKILAIKTGRKVYVYGDLPERLAEKLGVSRESRSTVKI